MVGVMSGEAVCCGLPSTVADTLTHPPTRHHITAQTAPGLLRVPYRGPSLPMADTMMMPLQGRKTEGRTGWVGSEGDCPQVQVLHQRCLLWPMPGYAALHYAPARDFGHLLHKWLVQVVRASCT